MSSKTQYDMSALWPIATIMHELAIAHYAAMSSMHLGSTSRCMAVYKLWVLEAALYMGRLT